MFKGCNSENQENTVFVRRLEGMTMLQQKHFQCSNASETRKMQLGGGFMPRQPLQLYLGDHIKDTLQEIGRHQRTLHFDTIL